MPDYTKSKVNGRYPVDTLASFTCNDGYSKGGSDNRRCLASGNWDGDDQTCNKGNNINWFLFSYFIFIESTERDILFVVRKKKKKSCFPSFAKVKLCNGKMVMMSELQKGDKVQTSRVLEF